jgi:hypothetical protein
MRKGQSVGNRRVDRRSDWLAYLESRMSIFN